MGIDFLAPSCSSVLSPSYQAYRYEWKRDKILAALLLYEFQRATVFVGFPSSSFPSWDPTEHQSC